MAATSASPGPAGLAEHLSTGVLVLDAGLRIRYVNPAAEQLTGRSRQQLADKVLHAAVPSLAALRPLLERAVVTGEAYARREVELGMVPDTGEPAMVDLAVSLMEHGGSDRLLVELTDASRRLRISRENTLLSQLDASRTIVRQLVHEIRNPLGGIRGAAQLLERRLPDPALAEYTRLIIRESDRLAKLARDLLGPGGPTDPETVNIHEVLEHVFGLARAEAPAAVLMERDYDPSLPPLTADRGQVTQAVLNLVRNALDAVGDHGQVVLRSRALTHFTIGDALHRLVVCVEVQDDGPGVPDSIRDTLFYPLVTSRDQGTGLGLALAQDLVRRQGGLIEYASRPGRTVFQMLFPVEEDHGRARA